MPLERSRRCSTSRSCTRCRSTAGRPSAGSARCSASPTRRSPAATAGCGRPRALRVLGLTDPLRIGLTPWFVRVRCTPDAAGVDRRGAGPAHRHPLGQPALRRHRDLLPGAAPPRPGEDDALLLQKLPRTPRVVQVTAHAHAARLLRPGPEPGEQDRAAGAPTQVRALRPRTRRRRRSGEPGPLGDGDRRMLDALAHGRAHPRRRTGRDHRLVADDGTAADGGAAGGRARSTTTSTSGRRRSRRRCGRAVAGGRAGPARRGGGGAGRARRRWPSRRPPRGRRTSTRRCCAGTRGRSTAI